MTDEEKTPLIVAIELVAMAAQNTIHVVENFFGNIETFTHEETIKEIDDVIEALELMTKSFQNVKEEMIKEE